MSAAIWLVSLLLSGAPLLTLLFAGWVFGRAAERFAVDFALPRGVVAEMTPSVIFSGLALARVVAVMPHWRMMRAHPLDLLRIGDQLSLVGGVIGAAAGVAVFARRGRLPVVPVASLYLTVLPLGLAAHEAGCLARNDCYGRTAPAPLGILFPGMRLPRYPVELYAAVFSLVLFAGLGVFGGTRISRVSIAITSAAAICFGQAALNLLRLSTEQGLANQGTQILVAFGALALALLGWRSALGAGVRAPDAASSALLERLGQSDVH